MASARSRPTFQDDRHQPNRLNPDDGYDYNNVEKSPEGTATREQMATPSKPQIPNDPKIDAQDGLFELTTINELEDQAHIYQRLFGQRRAKIPDVGEGRNDQVRPERLSLGYSFGGKQQTEPRRIMLRWTTSPQAKQGNVLNVVAPDTEIQQPDQQKRVFWQHSEHDVMSIEKLENSVSKCESRGLSEGEVAQTRRLLKRVRNLAEREFVGGSYLDPIAIRYDNQDISRYTVDKACIFFSFPYFSVATTKMRRHFKRGDLEHPPRTLLQSHYRLNKTIDRDKYQSIRFLERDTVRSCIKASDEAKSNISRKVTEELVYVPQFWGLIVGLDAMITCGCIGETALQGSAIKVTNDSLLSSKAQLSLVQILFIYQNRLEDLVYPINQCNSWFGLLNKQQQILDFIGDGKEKPKHRNYRFWLQEEHITIDNWNSVLQNAQSAEMIVLELKKDIPKTNVRSAEEVDSHHSIGKDPSSKMLLDETPKNPDLVPPKFSPFLTWPVLDEFGEPDTLPVTDRVGKFLRAIYVTLPTGDTMSMQERVVRPKLASEKHVGAKQSIPIAGKNPAQIRDQLQAVVAPEFRDSKDFASAMFRKFEEILRLFLPDPHIVNSAPINLYWGAVYEIIRKLLSIKHARSNFQEYSTNLSKFIFDAERLHRGVHCFQYFQDPTTEDVKTYDSIAQGTILLAVMVDAFGAIFSLLIETVRYIRNARDKDLVDLMGPKTEVAKHVKEACQLLEAARDQLIREADGAAKNDSIGPVLTPEAITITLMKRLFLGVFENGTVDIINVYEECLEDLALQVENQASRRLLQKINTFQEEVAVVSDVLKQQHKVLSGLRSSLDPDTFKTPSIARRLRFNFESKAIDKILISIREQLRNCSELRERAKLLALQNVQLVETLQDDNSKAIFIFTMVTVLFLPSTFVAGFFGMNLAGISGTQSTSSHFWAVALPLTFGVVLLCSVVAFKGEDVFFAFASVPRSLKRLLRD